MQYITVIGHLGRDIEEKQSANGETYYVTSIAVNIPGVEKGLVNWYWLHLFQNKRNQKIVSFLKKGTRLMINGRLNHIAVKSYKNEHNPTLSINVSDLEILSQPKSEDSVTEGIMEAMHKQEEFEKEKNFEERDLPF